MVISGFAFANSSNLSYILLNNALSVSVSVPNGEVVQSLGLDIESATLPTSTAFSITKSLDFSSSQYFSGVDVNGSSLSLLPQEWKWDFESGSFSSDWSLTGASKRYTKYLSYKRLTSVSLPVIAAAAAIAGETRCVRPPRP